MLLGRRPTDIRAFQQSVTGLKVDGDAGPETRKALHAALRALPAAPVAAPPNPDPMAAWLAEGAALMAQLEAWRQRPPLPKP